MPASIAEILAEVVTTIEVFIPSATVTLYIVFSLITSAALFLLRRAVKIGR